MIALTKTDIDQAIPERLVMLGRRLAHEPDIAQDASVPRRDDYRQVVEEWRLRDSLPD